MNETQKGSDLLAGAPADEPGLPGFGPAGGEAAGYRVLARKYRPRTFDDLIGQDAMVRTIANAFDAGRIPQAWMLTGVRGVGKTTTARILARGLNYELPEGVDGGKNAGPTIHMPQLGLHCQAIIDGNHIDVMEIDAASNNGVENVRQITDAVRYSPVSARYKVYIIDEVHMLSAAAFNAFLKTLEEPPPHAKFVFATTEIRKVPVTILSRCQRFDLRRVDAAVLIAHLNRICEAERVNADGEALALIARAAEGSVRDALSLLDQAIAHGSGAVSAETIRAMLGLADRARIIDLFEAVMRGDLKAAMTEVGRQYEAGADPAIVLADLAQFTHLVTRLKLLPEAAQDAALTGSERTRGCAFATQLSIRVLSRAWQILLNSIPEVQAAPRPLAAAEMVLVRLAYAADLPTPDEALKLLRDGDASANAGAAPRERAPDRATPLGFDGPRIAAGASGGPVLSAEPQPMATPTLRLARFEDLVALAAERRDLQLKVALERDVRLVRFEDGQIEFALADGASRALASDLTRRLFEWTGRRWVVAVSSQQGEATLHERAKARDAERLTGAAAHPLVRAVLEQFPGAAIVDVRDNAPGAAPEPVLPDDNPEADGDTPGS
jgi:DNA polymerase-3 subunit gamma/tau